MLVEAFEWSHGRHSTTRAYAKDGKTPLVTPFDGDCRACVDAIRSKAAEAVPLIRDIAISMRKEGRIFCTTAEVRRLCDWFCQAIPWQMRFFAEGRDRFHAMDRRVYRRLVKTFILACETLAVARAGTTSR